MYYILYSDCDQFLLSLDIMFFTLSSSGKEDSFSYTCLIFFLNIKFLKKSILKEILSLIYTHYKTAFWNIKLMYTSTNHVNESDCLFLSVSTLEKVYLLFCKLVKIKILSIVMFIIILLRFMLLLPEASLLSSPPARVFLVF